MCSTVEYQPSLNIIAMHGLLVLTSHGNDEGRVPMADLVLGRQYQGTTQRYETQHRSATSKSCVRTSVLAIQSRSICPIFDPHPSIRLAQAAGQHPIAKGDAVTTRRRMGSSGYARVSHPTNLAQPNRHYVSRHFLLATTVSRHHLWIP